MLSFCGGDDVAAPTTGSISVTAATTGNTGPVPDYSLTVDGNAGPALPANGSATIPTLSQGDHILELHGLPSGCTAAGENPRSVSVRAGETATTSFEISCSPDDQHPGALEVATTTTGDGLDPDGYQVSLDGGAPVTGVAINGVFSLSGISAGLHHITLSGVAGNCTVAPGSANPAAVTVVAGLTAHVDFVISCELPGSIEITTTTGGNPPDPDGYLVSVNGSAGVPVAPNGSVSIPNLLTGDYTVRLIGIAENCAVQQDNPVTLHVPPGAASPFAFDLSCRVLPVIHDVILFSSDRRTTGGQSHLFKMKPDGTGVVDLTQPLDGSQGQISPAGTRIAFTRFGDGGPDIYVMDADGSHVTQLAHGSGPSWSPDGQRISFTHHLSGNIWVMNADGTDSHRFSSGGGGLESAWSPDGQKIAYNRITKFCNFDICAMHIFVAQLPFGGGLDISGNGDQVDRRPAWSPDGSLIAYDEGLQIWTVHPDGSGNVKISQGNRAEQGPVWSPDGSKIAVTRMAARAQIYIMNADGSGATNLSQSSSNDFVTSWR